MVLFLETERVLLRRFTEDDVDNLFELDSDPEVMRFLTGGIPTPRAVIQQEVLPNFLRYYERFAGYGFWAAVDKASGDFLGWFHFRPPEGAGPGEVELGYRLRNSAWGNGYATEVSRALIRKGFRELGCGVSCLNLCHPPGLQTGHGESGDDAGEDLPRTLARPPGRARAGGRRVRTSRG